MALPISLFLLLVLGYVSAAPASDGAADSPAAPELDDKDDADLNTAASNTYTRRYSDWSGYNYPSGGGYNQYGVTGYGIVDDKYNNYYGGSGGYDNSLGHGGYSRYNSYNNGYNGYNNGYGYNTGYNKGYGGYGGYGGNGGLNSYYGYNNPYYQGANHLGYGYYSKPGYGNIYSSGITPSLVTGYRGYSRR